MATTRIPLRELPERFGASEFDLIICCASFEDRCLSVPTGVDPNSTRHALICYTCDRTEPVQLNLDRLKTHFGTRHSLAELSTRDPIKTADSLWLAVKRISNRPDMRIMIDVTTFMHEGLLILLRVLSQTLGADAKVWVAYTPAAEYALGVPEAEKWLSKGIGEIRSVLGYPGRILPSRKIHLILLTGFENERAAALIDAYEPNVLSLGLGQSDYPRPNNIQAGRVLTLTKRRTAFGEVANFEFARFDYSVTANALDDQLQKYPDHSIVIAPMNTKLSTIGASLCALRNQEVQLCYATAHMYNVEGYSRGADYCIYGEFPELAGLSGESV